MSILKNVFLGSLKGTKLFRGPILLLEPGETFAIHIFFFFEIGLFTNTKGIQGFKHVISNLTQFISDLHFQKASYFLKLHLNFSFTSNPFTFMHFKCHHKSKLQKKIEKSPTDTALSPVLPYFELKKNRVAC